MNGIELIAHILKREGVEWFACFPNNPLIEAAAKERYAVYTSLGGTEPLAK